MCSCTSCEHTDKLRSAGFAEWPKGEAVGKRRSESLYAAHVRHSQQGGRRLDGNMHTAPEIPASVLKGSNTGGGARYQRPAGRFPGEADAKAGLKAYIAAFEHLNGLRPVPVVKPTPYLLNLARELRRAA